MTTRPFPLLRAFAVTAIMLASLSFTSGATAQFNDGSPDLVAMLLRASDYDTIGLDGDIGRNSGTCLTAQQYALSVAGFYGADPAEFAATLEEVGLGDSCEAFHVWPGDQSESPVYFRTYVHHYDDEDGATEGFAFLEDESDDPSIVDIPEGAGLGDESEASVSSGEDEDGAYEQIDVSFRVGTIHGGVTITDYTGDVPPPATAIGLAEVMIDRVESVMEGDAPHMGQLLAPMAGEGLPPVSVVRYNVLDGEYERYAGETGEQFEERVAKWDGEENVFFFGQAIPPAEGERPIQYGVYLAEYGSADEAVAYVEDTIPRLESDEDNADIVENEDVGQYGDASIAVTYTSTANNTTSQLDRMYVAVDSYVISTYFVYTSVPAGVIEAPTAIQVACVENGGCDDTVPVPETFSDLPAATPGPADDEGDERDGDDAGKSALERAGASIVRDREQPGDDEAGEDGQDSGSSPDQLYESETHPYTIAYSDDWTMDEPQVIGEMELLTLSNGMSGIVIIVDTTHEGDVEACLDGAIAFVEDQEGVVSIEVLEDGNGDPIEGSSRDAAYTAIAYEFEDGSEMALYAECRVVVDGETTMEFNQFVALDDFDDEVEAREDLLAGVEIDN